MRMGSGRGRAVRLEGNTAVRNEDAQRGGGGVLGDVVDWLGEACSSLGQTGRTHLLRSPGRPLLLSPLENLGQILHTEGRISAAWGRWDTGPDVTSLNINP